MSSTTYVCAGAADHAPAYAETDRHHIYPTFLCSLLGIAARPETVRLCAGCHDNVHHVLRHLINTGLPGGHRLPAGSRAVVYAAWAWWQEAAG